MGAGGAWPGFETGPGCGGRGRRRGLAGLQDRSHRAVRLACGDHAGRPPPTDATHGRIKQPGPTDTRHQTRATSYTRNTSGPLPPPTDTAHYHRPQMPPTGASSSPAPQACATRHAPRNAPPGTRPETRPEHQRPHKHTPEATESGPEPLGSGPPSILSDYRRHATGGATRQVALRGRWCHATGEHQCATAVSCQ